MEKENELNTPKTTVPAIAIDLDGTLTLTDTLHESVVAMVRRNPLYMFLLPFWLLRGKAALKAEVADRVDIDATSLPYNQPLIDWLKEERAAGRRIVLCSATNQRIAHAVSAHLQLFDEVIASDNSTNLKSGNKRKALDERFGTKGYDYAGNSSADISVWEGSRQAIVVNASESLTKKANRISTVERVFKSPVSALAQWGRALRLHQWLKNGLLFVPILAAHEIGNLQSVSTLLLAFLSFSLCASVVYVINDLLDLESDRKHPRKRFRPFAAGVVPIAHGVALVPFLLLASLTLGVAVGPSFLAWLLVYFALTMAYSLSLKRQTLIDCLTLAALYTLRIIAGAAAVAITLSFWLLAFSIFIFLSLAFVKRYAELQVWAQAGRTRAHGRGYEVIDAPLVQTLGIAAGYAAIIVLALYLQGETVVTLYAQPELIWLAVPLMIFWVSWVWIKAHRGQMHDDPLAFALKDKASITVAVLIALAFTFATKGVSF
jgi:4-hydroxybenzoate polyprenyltransferase/phosphoserine phosphatase